MSGPTVGVWLWFDDHVQAYRGVAAAVGSRAFGLAVCPAGRRRPGVAGQRLGSGCVLAVILRKSKTQRTFLLSFRRVWATSSPRALMRPMAKRRRRVVFSGPLPVRMRLRSSSHDQSRQWVGGVFDAPMASVQGQDVLCIGGVGGVACDAVGGFDAGLSGCFAVPCAADHEDLADAREVEVLVEGGGGPNRPLLDGVRARWWMVPRSLVWAFASVAKSRAISRRKVG